MRLADLSEQSGVAPATIKYYLREGLLPPGRLTSATQADYDDSHLRRLRLVRALIHVGGLSVATAREVLGHVDDESLGRTIRLGAALWAIPRTIPTDESDDPATVTARAEVDRLLERLGWTGAREIGPLSPVYRELVTAVAALTRLGYQAGADELAPYAEQMRQVAALDLDLMERYPTPLEQVEAAVAAAVLFEPVLSSLRRLAEEDEAARRYGY